MLHNRQNYDFVRTSIRTNKTESGNGEIYTEPIWWETVLPKIRVNGNEYVDIFPVWEWDRIPGNHFTRRRKTQSC